MNYTIDKHTKREKVRDDKGKPVIIKDDHGKPVAKVKKTEGFIVRANDAMVGFYETKEEAIKAIEKEQKNPSVLPGMSLTIESHRKREKVFDKDGKVVFENGQPKIKITDGFNLRTADKVVMFSEKRSDLVKKIQEITGITNPAAAEASVKPKKDVTREPKKQKAK